MGDHPLCFEEPHFSFRRTRTKLTNDIMKRGIALILTVESGYHASVVGTTSYLSPISRSTSAPTQRLPPRSSKVALSCQLASQSGTPSTRRARSSAPPLPRCAHSKAAPPVLPRLLQMTDGQGSTVPPPRYVASAPSPCSPLNQTAAPASLRLRVTLRSCKAAVRLRRSSTAPKQLNLMALLSTAVLGLLYKSASKGREQRGVQVQRGGAF